MNDQPKNGCAPGLGVSDKDECKEACENLGITVPIGNLKIMANRALPSRKKHVNRAIASEIRLTGFAKKRVSKMICLAVVYC